MTQLNQLKCFYSQFQNLSDEIKSMIDSEEYNEAISKVLHKENLVKQFLDVRKAVVLTEDEKKEAEAMEKDLMEQEESNIDRLMNLRGDVSSELKKTKKNLKLNNAYSVNDPNKGSMLDLTE